MSDFEQDDVQADDAPDFDALERRLKGWFKRDFDSKGQTTWRREAREDYAFEAGDQLSDDDKQILRDMNRPIVIFNRVGVTVDCVAGQEVANRQEVQFIPREQGDVVPNEMLTAAAKWFRQQCDAEDEESDSFRDTVVCGMGWTETRLDYDENPEGDPRIDRIDPLEMVWDSGAKKRNLGDLRRVFHIRRDVPLDEAKALCPGDTDNPFEDEDYNATWVDDRPNEGAPHENNGAFYNKEDAAGGDADDQTVTLVRAQWWERVPVWLVVDPTDGTGKRILTLSKDDFESLAAKAKIAGAPPLRSVKSTRKVYKQAYIGNVLLEISDAPCKDHFSFKCITGKRDRNKNTYFGIVRAMKDPARWSNKWMSQTMHIMNTTAKGGIAAERGKFFENDADGEASWAKQDQVTHLKEGALSGPNPKFIQKPVGQFPQGSFELMQFAVQSLPQVSGVNIEMLGLQQGSGQAAALDRQRKQSVMIILQPLFDGLRRYRKDQGRLMLYLIQNFLSDGRLIKIEGPEKAQYVPLIKQASADYDVVVDEAPTSANQKEATWDMLQQILPVIGKMLPPATWLALLKYSPLPTSAQKDISDSLQQAQSQPDPEQEKRDADLQAANAKTAAEIENARKLTDAKIEGMQREADAKRRIDFHQARHDVALNSATAGASNDNTALMSIVEQMSQQIAALTAALGAPR